MEYLAVLPVELETTGVELRLIKTILRQRKGCTIIHSLLAAKLTIITNELFLIYNC